MLLLMIYGDDKYKALTNKATVSRVRHRAIKFKIVYYKLKQKVSLLGNKRNGHIILCCPIAQSTVSSRIDLTVNIKLFIIVFNSIHSRVMFGHRCRYEILLFRRFKLNLLSFNQIMYLILQDPAVIRIMPRAIRVKSTAGVRVIPW